MNRKCYLAFILCTLLVVEIGSASVCIEGSYDDKVLVSDSSEPYEIYLGVLNPNSGMPIGLEPLPVAGDGYIIEQVNAPQGIYPYPKMYHIESAGVPNTGVQFGFPANYYEMYVVYDRNFDLIGIHSVVLDPSVYVTIEGVYELGPGDSVELIGWQFNVPGYVEWVAGVDYSSKLNGGWSIDGRPVPQLLTYEYLTRNLSLAEGAYDLSAAAYWDYDGTGELVLEQFAKTTITIVPEPIGVSLSGLGGLAVRARIKQYSKLTVV